MSLGRLWPSWGCARPLICFADKGGLIGREQRSNYAEYTFKNIFNELQDGEKQKRTPRTLVRAMPKQYNMVIEQLSRRQQRAVKDERT